MSNENGEQNWVLPATRKCVISTLYALWVGEEINEQIKLFTIKNFSIPLPPSRDMALTFDSTDKMELLLLTRMSYALFERSLNRREFV